MRTTFVNASIATLLLGAFVLFVYPTARWFSLSVVIRQDFVEYWASGRLFLRGGNPYDEASVAAIQASLGRSQPIFMWNGPWLLTATLPLYFLNYADAAGVWFFVSLGCLACALVLFQHSLLRIGGYRLSTLETILLPLTFYPLWSSLVSGQMGLVLLLGSSLLINGLVTKNSWRVAGGCLLFSIKPHLVTLLIPVLLVIFLREDLKKIVIRTSLLCLALTLTTLLIAPMSYAQWMERVSSLPLQFVGATFAGFLRSQLVDRLDFRELVWINTLLPLLSFLWMTVWVLRKRARSYLFTAEDNIKLIPLSVFLSAYGWVFDFSLLLPTYLYAFGTIRQLSYPSKALRAGTLIASQLTIPTGIALGYTEHQMYFWVPLIIYLALRRSSEPKPNADPVGSSNDPLSH